jgi:NAD(P)-dependent dehydrogenase (short-subunit alcohol dehydrogenase family)
MFSLKGKTAVVTGSDRGIGFGIAGVLAKAGASVVISSRHKERCEEACRKLRASGATARAVECDVSVEDEVKALVEAAAGESGKVDIFVNNAGVLLQKPVDAVLEKEWDWLLGINLKGVFFGTKHAAAQMKRQGGGSIVNIASIAAIRGYQGLTAYCASKGGIAGFTRAAAAELAASKIRVNAILPGVVESDMTKGMKEDKKAWKAMIDLIPLRMAGQPEDIGYGALYLASDEAKYVTGVSLVIDGGDTLV